MSPETPEMCSAFAGTARIASGPPVEVARAVKARLDDDPELAVLVFDDATGAPVELDLRGTLSEVLGRFPPRESPELPEPTAAEEPLASRPPGRPRLGVVAREVTLLPRHWEWLAGQPGGASVALRKLVEQARRANEAGDRRRRARETAYRVMSVLGGNLPGFEEASRALFAGDRERFEGLLEPWPPDFGRYLRSLAAGSFDPPSGAEPAD